MSSLSNSFGEHLLTLVQVGAGLQSRIYHFHSTLNGSLASRPSVFKDPDYDKVRKSLEKHFPKRDVAAKEKGWDKMHDTARTHEVELVDHIGALKEVARFREVVQAALRRSPGMLVKDPRGSVLPEEQFWPGSASRALLDLLVVYGRLMIQMEKLGGDAKTAIAVYNACHFALHGNDDSDFVSVLCPLMKLFDESNASGGASSLHSPIIRVIVSEVMVENGDTLGDVVSYLLEKVLHWFVPTQNKLHNVWQLDTFAACTTEESADVADLSKAVPVCFRQSARSWIIWAMLLCPTAFSSSRAKFSEQARLEPLLKVILVESIVEVIFREQVIRLHDEFHELFSFFPGKVLPALKETFEGSFTVKPKKLVNDCAIECTNRAALIHRERRVILAQLLLSMSSLLSSNKALLGPKIGAVLAVLSASKDELTWYIAHHRAAPPKVHQTGGVLGIFAFDSGSKFVKEDWVDSIRFGVLLSCHCSLYDKVQELWPISFAYTVEMVFGPLLQEVQLRRLTEHEQGIRALSPSDVDLTDIKLLELRFETSIRNSSGGSLYSTCAGFGDYFLPHLFFHLSLLEKNSREGPMCLTTFAGLGNIFFSPFVNELFEDTLNHQPRHCLAFVDLLTHVEDVLSPYCPEEYMLLGGRVSTWAELFFKRIQEKLIESLDAYRGEIRALDSQLDPIKAADRILRLREEKQSLSNTSNTLQGSSSETKPGMESKTKNRNQTALLARAQRSVRGICASLGRKKSSTLVVWNTVYVLREIQRETLTAWLNQSMKQSLYPPSQLKAHLQRTFNIIHFACEHGGGMDAVALIKHGLFLETDGDSGSLVESIAKMLIAFVDTRLSQVVYSDFAQGFLRPFPAVGDVHNLSLPENWINSSELHHLRTILGTRGMEHLCRRFSALIGESAGKIKRWLLEDEATLNDFKRTIAAGGQTGDVLRVARSPKNGENIVLALRTIGGLLQIGDMLHLGDSLLSGLEPSPMLWSLVSFSLAASLVSAPEFWKQADYINHLDCHANNAHVVVAGLFRVLKQTQDENQLKSREVDFLKSFSTVLLLMKRDQFSEFKDWPLRGIVILLECIIRESNFLEARDLDVYVPFPIVHAAVIDRVLGKVHGLDQGLLGIEGIAKLLGPQQMVGAKQVEGESIA